MLVENTSNYSTIKDMITYDYHCDANGETITVSHSIKETLTTWGELCPWPSIEWGRLHRNTSQATHLIRKPKPDESTLSMFSKSKSQGGCCGSC